MAPSSATRSAKAPRTRRTRKARASKAHEAALSASDGEGEGATRANQAEVQKAAEDIKNKLGELTDPNADLDQLSRDFLNKVAADEVKITTMLDEAKAAVFVESLTTSDSKLTQSSGKDKASDEELLLQLLGTALAPASAVLGAAAPKYTKPIPILHVSGRGQYLQNETVRLLEESRALLHEYEELNTLDSGESPLEKAVAKFNHDSETTEDVLASGRKAGKRAVENMLADKYNEVRERTQISTPEKEMAQLFVPADRQDEDMTMEGHEGWGSIADKSRRAAQKMVVDTKDDGA